MFFAERIDDAFRIALPRDTTSADGARRASEVAQTNSFGEIAEIVFRVVLPATDCSRAEWCSACELAADACEVGIHDSLLACGCELKVGKEQKKTAHRAVLRRFQKLLEMDFSCFHYHHSTRSPVPVKLLRTSDDGKELGFFRFHHVGCFRFEIEPQERFGV